MRSSLHFPFQKIFYISTHLGAPVKGNFWRDRKFPDELSTYPSVVLIGLLVVTPGTSSILDTCLPVC